MGEQDEVATLHAAIGDLDVATTGLRGHFWRALARPGVAGATESARSAAADADDLARDRLARGDAEGALRVLEAARGLTLYAATEVRPVTDYLVAAGQPDLARQWQAAASVADPHHLPSELRRGVLGALLTRSPAAGLLGPPTAAEIQYALAATDADALVHLIPGHAVVVAATGRITHLPLPALTPATDHIERFLATLALHNAVASAARPPAKNWAALDRQPAGPARWPAANQPRPGKSRPGASRPGVSWFGAARPGAARPEVASPDVSWTDVSRTDGDRPEMARSEEPADVDLTESLDELGRWAWDAVVGPLLDHLAATRFPGAAPVPIPALGGSPSRRDVPRVILVAPGDLARVPWAAAMRGDGAYAVELMAISQAESARMFCRNAALPPMPAATGGLIVADPETDGQARELPSARLEAYAVSQALFPQARLTGRRPDGTASPSGAGTLDQVRAWLTTSNPTAGSLLHLACTGFARPGSDAYALMAGGVRLTATEVLALRGRAQRRSLDLVVLAGGRTGLSLAGYDDAFGLGTAFLAGGARSVLATRWAVPDAAAPAVLFMTHLLRRSGQPAWAALRAAQLWMLDPRRVVPPEMPPELAAAVARTDPGKAIAWAAVTHWGQ